ncbi:hypothetical protein Q8F55_002728 [Vanrija albida]|uniref:BTB domain-containing protein n=1 Tax=Vanrija albida TaxID=181172 RepID=A0ABR3QAL5_9TREE
MALDIGDTEIITDDTEWTSSDFTLISADNVRFRVPSFFILAAMPVFRDAGGGASVSNDKIVYFTDSSFETASTLRTFCQLITTARLPSWEEGEYAELSQHITDVVTFLRKYECDAMLETFKLAFHYNYLHSADSDFSLEGLVLGSVADDLHFCIEAMYTNSWEPPTDVPHQKIMMLVPFNMPLKVHNLIPPTYLWALSSAWQNADNDMGKFRELFRSLVHHARRG